MIFMDLTPFSLFGALPTVNLSIYIFVRAPFSREQNCLG